MSLYKAEGIILKTYNLGEADRILIIYTREYGKISCVAKGVRRSRSKLRGFTQPLTYADLVISPGKSLDTITQSVPKEMFAEIREDLERWAYTNYLAELLISMMPERQAHEAVFFEFLRSLHLVAKLEQPSLGAIYFTVKLLQLSGYQPQLKSCSSCHTLDEKEKYIYLSGEFGGVLCENCRYLDPRALRLQRGEIAFWYRLGKIDVKLLSRLKISPVIEERLIKALFYYYQYQLERQLKSPSFLNHLQSLRMDKKDPL